MAADPRHYLSEALGTFVLVVFKGKAGLSANGFLSGTYSGNQDKQIYALGVGGWIQP